MNCAELRTLMDAYIDGELDLMRSLEVERHLRDCAACTVRFKNQQTLKSAFQGNGLYFAAPATLQQHIQASLREASRTEKRKVKPSSLRSWQSLRWLGTIASLAAMLILVFGIARSTVTSPSNDLLTQQIIASHVHSLMVNHLTDVASSDQHTVKPWFTGKLNFSPWVEDLASQSFPLIGGRLDYVDNQPVAALIYQRNKHYINLFQWPSSEYPTRSDAATNSLSRQGYHLFYWKQADMTFWAISDVNNAELEDFVRLVQNRIAVVGP